MTWGVENKGQGWIGFLDPISNESLSAHGAFFSHLFVDEIYGGGKALVTGEAGRALGERGVRIVEMQTGRPFTGSAEEWMRFGRGIGGELTGVNALVEGASGYDISNGRRVCGVDRATRLAAGVGGVTGTVAGALSSASRLSTLGRNAPAQTGASLAGELGNVGKGAAGTAKNVATSTRLQLVNTGGLRNEAALTAEQMVQARAIAIEYGATEEMIRFSSNMNTGYANLWGQEVLYVGSDVLPAGHPGVGGMAANSRLTMRSSIAHELYGHRAVNLALNQANPSRVVWAGV